MVLLALVSIGILGVLEFGDLREEDERNLLYADLFIVFVFWVEYLWRLGRVGRKGAFVGSNWYELPGMVPILPGMEAYGSMRLFRLLRILRILRLMGALRRFDRFNALVNRFTHQSRLGTIALLASGVTFACAASAWLLEPESFPSFGDALWWAVVTSTTVGYGDFYPTTGAVRAVAVVLMLLGIGLIGAFAATLSTFLVERRIGNDRRSAAGTDASDVVSRLERLDQLRRRGGLTSSEYSAAKRKLLK